MSNIGGNLEVGFWVNGASNTELESRMPMALFVSLALLCKRDLDRMWLKNFMIGCGFGGGIGGSFTLFGAVGGVVLSCTIVSFSP